MLDMNTVRASLAALIGLLPLTAFAQDTDSESELLDAAIDEITIVGARTLGSMRAEVVIAEDRAFELFNDFNDDDGYDIICKRETRIGSQIPKRVCLARMYRETLAEATIDEDFGDLRLGRMTGSDKHQKILQEKMRALAMEHPELLSALQKRYALEQKFKQARDEKYGE